MTVWSDPAVVWKGVSEKLYYSSYCGGDYTEFGPFDTWGETEKHIKSMGIESYVWRKNLGKVR